MAIIIKPDGTVVEYKGAQTKLTLDEMQTAVGGAIEHIPYKFQSEMKKLLPKNAAGKLPCTGWCDEEGKCTGKAANIPATRLFNTFGDVLTGDILLCYAGES